MKRIILNESQLKILLNEITLNGYDWQTIARYIKSGYLVHGTTEQFDKFDTSKIKGSTRAEYGYGMYFTDESYKALEYGNEIYLTKKDLYNFLDLETSNYYIFNMFDKIKEEIYNANEMLYNVRTNREYDYYENLINELKSKINLNDYEQIVLSDFKKCFNNNPRNLEQAFKYVRNNLPPHFDKYISSLLLKSGYDGVKCGNQYVIFNFDLLNNNLINYDVD